MDHAAALSRGDELNAQFLALVCADEELLCAEFDAIIAAGWGCAHLYRLRESAGVGGITARLPPPSLREDARLNSSRIGHLAFSAATWTHSISAVFLASRLCAFMSPSR